MFYSMTLPTSLHSQSNQINLPLWQDVVTRSKPGFHEAWYIQLNDLGNQSALWLRFDVLLSDNGFRKIAETWAVFYKRDENRDVQKTAVKQAFDVKNFSSTQGQDHHFIKISECELGADYTRGSIQNKGKSIQWDLHFAPKQKASFQPLPSTSMHSRLIKTHLSTPSEDLIFSGEVVVDGTVYSIVNAGGMQAHLAGPKNAHSWIWGHCNSFENERGEKVPFIFEGLSASARIAGHLKSPQFSSFYFLYQGKSYEFNRFWDAFRSRSKHTLTEWTFHAEREEISFRGQAKAQLRDFAGMTYEDTDGSLLYSASSKLSDLTISVYRRGKLETTLKSIGTTALEVVSRTKNPYVPLLI